MTIESTIRLHLTRALEKLGISQGNFLLEHPDDLAHGDFSTNVALVYAKELSQKPRDLAEKIVAHLLEDKKSDHLKDVQDITIAGPGFINFHLVDSFFRTTIKTIVEEAEQFGKGDQVIREKNSKEALLIEHTSPNPNKAMHLGHLRNNITGMAIATILDFVGYKVIRDAVDNDRGIAIAKLMWGYLAHAHKTRPHERMSAEETRVDYWFDHQNDWFTPGEKKMRPDKFVDELYIQGSEDFKQEEVEKKVRQLVVDWEAGNEKVWALWRRVLEYSHLGQELTLTRLGNKWDYVWHEHEHYKLGKDLINEGLKKGIFTQLPDGAVLTHLESYKIPDTILIKSDGTSLYITQDIALTKLKRDKFHPNKMFWVIGPEQALAMKQVFAVCEQLGIGKIEDFEHLSYGYMSIKGKGKMSSREGTVLYIDDIIDEAKKEIFLKIHKESFKNEEEMDRTTEIIAIGAVKYSILKAARTSDIAFDFDTSLDFEGDSGPYLQYSYVRARSIVEKARAQGILPSFENAPKEVSPLEKTLYRFPEIVARSAREYAPHHIATYLITVSALFNNYYAHNKVIDTDDETSAYKVALTEAFSYVIKNGLSLLGIDVPLKM